ncbi:hypothetical protein ACPMCT_20070 [Clostridioides difficile]|uniref:hypothetical protein n=1 Tax=Clostridioides difficile TaxID=1496 RepID=UPI00038CAEE6|nr:hypothetical protein [Clostridioides difficile]EQJ94763.1 hypothetical protein QUA_0918 [Clostridioides difficile P49]MCH7327279.1 hypothetical protein [Clostridioides difficile]MCI4737430.1 hypothetical protein [Clostridioides difficile]MCP8421232.1 hypothetical protein [Clostridioides difficile]MCR1589832.1 hypothetical protein [Clostridioides difficile]
MDSQFTVIHNLKPITRMSKSKLKDMLGIFKTSTRKIEKTDHSVCNSCNIRKNYSLHEDRLDDFCSNCPKIKTFTEFSYVIEKETNTIGTIEIVTNENKTISLSKSAIKQFIAYHFIPCNKNFVRKSVSFKNIADICNVSVVTARYNHSILIKAGLVYSTKVKRGKFDIVIDGEYKNHLKKSDGGQGYITMSLDTLKHLLKFDNVNELKLEIKKLLWADANTSKGKKVKFNKENLISVLPSYLRKSSKRLEAFLKDSKTLFNISNNRIDTSRYETKEKVRNRYINFIKEKIEKFFSNTGCSLSANYSKVLEQVNLDKHELYKEDLNRQLELEKELIINDLVGLSIQYSINIVLKTLNYVFNEYTIDENDINYSEIKNPGAFIRTIIVKNINKNGSLKIVI